MEDEQVLWPSTVSNSNSNSNSNSMVSATLGRVMSTLLSARPKKLQDAISRLHSPPKRGSFVTLEESLWILHTYVREAAQREDSLDEILVPITQHDTLWKEQVLRLNTVINLEVHPCTDTSSPFVNLCIPMHRNKGQVSFITENFFIMCQSSHIYCMYWKHFAGGI
ncbi:hypothetical protein ACSBR1_020379 [Camellia fascicularis]